MGEQPDVASMPVWVPDRPNNVAFSRRSIKKALAAGLTFRPLAVTAKDTLDWNKTRPAADLETLAKGARAGISAERESEVLAAWKSKQASAANERRTSDASRRRAGASPCCGASSTCATAKCARCSRRPSSSSSC